MKGKLLLQQAVSLVMVILLLAGCTGTPFGIRVTPTPTVTPTPIPVMPKPNSGFSGTIDAGDKASNGKLTFGVSESGNMITSMSISLENVNCHDMITEGSVFDEQRNPQIPITDGMINGTLSAIGGMISDYHFNPPDPYPTPVPDPYTVGKITGHFTTPTIASGEITIFLGAPFSRGVVGELGTFAWSATSEE